MPDKGMMMWRIWTLVSWEINDVSNATDMDIRGKIARARKPHLKVRRIMEPRVVARKGIASNVVDLDIGRSSVMQLPIRMEPRSRILANHQRKSTRYRYPTQMVREGRLNSHHLARID